MIKSKQVSLIHSYEDSNCYIRHPYALVVQKLLLLNVNECSEEVVFFSGRIYNLFTLKLIFCGLTFDLFYSIQTHLLKGM